jgi:NFU1 iron-sulfur cluster scaffold homolog, mitochondrial
MLSHYVPSVKSVEQIVDDEELVALQEFEKLEKKLNAKNIRVKVPKQET